MSLAYYKNKNGTTYVYDSVSYWDKDKQQSRSKRTCIGKLDDDGNIVYSKRFDKDVPEAVPKAKRGPVPAVHTRRLFYGATYLLDQIGDKLGITADLKECFPAQWRQILSITYFLILEDTGALLRFEKWGNLHRHPFGEDIPSQRSTELFQSINEEAKNRFLQLQGKRRIENEFLAYDTTSISSYSETLKQVQYGKNKEDDKLPQFNLALVYGQETNLPYYYRKLAGNIPDVSTLKTLLADLDDLGFGKLKVILDRGFYSEANINALYKDHLKFLIAASTSLNFVKKALEQVYDELDLYKYYDENHHLYATTVQTEWDYTEERPYKKDVIADKRRIYVHLFYNADRAAADRAALEERITSLWHELMENRTVPEHANQYKKYFIVRDTPKRGREVIVKDETLKKARRYYGYFALISNIKMDAITALETYRNRDLAEKAFGNIKDRLNLRRALASSEQGLNGKLFVAFVALIYLSYIKHQMQINNLYSKNTMQQVFDKLDVIECFENPGDALRVGEVLKKQHDLYIGLGVEPPVPYLESSL